MTLPKLPVMPARLSGRITILPNLPGCAVTIPVHSRWRTQLVVKVGGQAALVQVADLALGAQGSAALIAVRTALDARARKCGLAV